MPDTAPLNLADIDPPLWRVIVEDTAYGPYTLGQLQSFIGEGRLGPASLVAKGDGAPILEARNVPELDAKFSHHSRDRMEKTPQNEQTCNYLIVTRLSGAEEASLVQALNSLGNFGGAMPGAYVLSSTSKLAAVQKRLSEAVGTLDQVLIVNATTNRLGWFNLGPEADIHLRAIWNRPQAADRPQ